MFEAIQFFPPQVGFVLSPRRSNLCRLFTLCVLVLYGSGGVLGYGLHKFLDCEHCNSVSCSHAVKSCHEAHHCCPCEHHQAPRESDPVDNLVATHSDCLVCAFLAQAQSPCVEFSYCDCIEPIEESIPVSEEIGPLYLPHDHYARGPPIS